MIIFTAFRPVCGNSCVWLVILSGPQRGRQCCKREKKTNVSRWVGKRRPPQARPAVSSGRLSGAPSSAATSVSVAFKVRENSTTCRSESRDTRCWCATESLSLHCLLWQWGSFFSLKSIANRVSVWMDRWECHSSYLCHIFIFANILAPNFNIAIIENFQNKSNLKSMQIKFD